MAGGGIGEAALLGAAMGGGSSILTGRDPLQGALMGGLMGGAGGAIFGPAAGGAEAAGASAAGANTGQAAANIMANQPAMAATQQALTNQGLLQSGLDLGGFNPATMGAAQQATNSGIASLMPTTLGGKIAAGTAGLGALSMLSDRNKFGVPTPEHYDGPLSKFRYDPSRYEPYTYRPYAGGGAVEAMSNANAVGANTGFPMADISRGAYATPYQQPISQNILTGPQDTRVDAYTGQERLAEGGIASLASGGISDLGGYSDGGRLLRGPGDGVSDSIPATIGGRQPARLADGEFVVPARIVSELGNGSTDAGARELYKMMNRVQSARGKTTGKNRVAKDTQASKYLPA